MMRIAQIRKIDVANGEGVRTSLFVSGCKHNCYNCFNKEYQNFNYGEVFSNKHIKQLQEYLDLSYISGLSILGGEPMEHPKPLKYLLNALKFRDEQDIWLWSGYTLEQILLDDDKKSLLNYIDVLIDGLYVDKLKDLSLKFRGSSNQRIIRRDA